MVAPLTPRSHRPLDRRAHVRGALGDLDSGGLERGDTVQSGEVSGLSGARLFA